MAPEPGRRRHLLFAGIVALLVAAAVEAVAQAFYYFSAGAFLFTTSPIYEPDDVRCFRVKTNLAHVQRSSEFTTAIYTNAQGFRTDARREPTALEKPADVYRVLALGPSFAFGWGSDYEDTYAARIARGLRVPGRRVELLNLGTPGQSPAPQLCWLAKVGHRYEPDLVLLTVYRGHVTRLPTDCPEPLTCPWVYEGRLFREEPTLARRLRGRLKHSAALFYAFYAYTALVPGAPGGVTGTGSELRSPEEPDADDRDPARLVELTRGYVSYVKSVLGPDVDVAILHVPLSYVVHPEDAPRWRHVDVPPREAAIAQVEADVAALRDAGVTIIHTTPTLVEAARAERLYYWLDIHLTPAGNRVVADVALPVLQGLVSARAGG